MPIASTNRVPFRSGAAFWRLVVLAGCVATATNSVLVGRAATADGDDPPEVTEGQPSPIGPLVIGFTRLDFQQQRQLIDAIGVEHGRVRLVSELTPEQEAQLETLGPRTLLERCEQLQQPVAERADAADPRPALLAKVAKAVADLVAAPANQVQPQEQVETLRRLLFEQLDREMRQLLSDQQWDRYQEERQAREAFEFLTNSDLLLMIVDREIRLAESQREPIREATRSWVLEHASSLQFYFQNEDFVPDISKQIETLVTPDQWEHWKQRRTINISGQFQTGWGERLKKHFFPEAL